MCLFAIHLQVTSLEMAGSVKLTAHFDFTAFAVRGGSAEADFEIRAEMYTPVDSCQSRLHPFAKAFATSVTRKRHDRLTILGKIGFVRGELIQVESVPIAVETVHNFICRRRNQR